MFATIFMAFESRMVKYENPSNTKLFQKSPNAPVYGLSSGIGVLPVKKYFFAADSGGRFDG